MQATLLILPLALLALGMPIYIGLLTTTLIVILFMTSFPIGVVAQNVFGGLSNYSILSVPLFIFAGDLMSRGSISRRIIAWVDAFVGSRRAGTALSTIAASEFFGAISGSSAASVAAIGSLMYPELNRKNYDRRFTLGLLTTSGAIASIIPPSILMILYGASAQVSIAKLFIAGIIPGLLIGALWAGYVVFATRKQKVIGGARFSFRNILQTSYRGLFALGMPAVILGGIYLGVVTPTEAAAVACIYGAVVSFGIYRDATLKQLWHSANDSMLLSGKLLIIAAAAGAYSWLLTVAGVPQALVGFVAELGLGQVGLVLMLNLILLVVGCFIDPVSAILILTPLLAPLAELANMDLIHFGIILVVNLSIGMFTPPFGMNIFTVQALFNPDIRELYLGVVPFLIVALVGLLLITFIPPLSLVLL